MRGQLNWRASTPAPVLYALRALLPLPYSPSEAFELWHNHPETCLILHPARVIRIASEQAWDFDRAAFAVSGQDESWLTGCVRRYAWSLAAHSDVHYEWNLSLKDTQCAAGFGVLIAICDGGLDGNRRPGAEDVDVGAGEAGVGSLQSNLARGPDRDPGIPRRRDYGVPATQPGPDGVDRPVQSPVHAGHPYRPLTDTEPFLSGSYLIERRHKRDLRRESARQGTAIAISELDDQKRNLLFDLRGAFVQVLQQKAVVAVTRESLEFYDRMLAVSRDRYKAGDIAQVDLDRLELQRVQFETDVQTALVNLRTAKIQLQMLLNDRTPVEQLDVSGRFDYAEILTPLEELRQNAFDSRADLRAAVQAVDKARTDYRLAVANGSTDPTFQWDVGHQQGFVLLSASASLFRCASSTGTRAKRRARSSTSSETSGWWRRTGRRCSATSIRRTPRYRAI